MQLRTRNRDSFSYEAATAIFYLQENRLAVEQYYSNEQYCSDEQFNGTIFYSVTMFYSTRLSNSYSERVNSFPPELVAWSDSLIG